MAEDETKTEHTHNHAEMIEEKKMHKEGEVRGRRPVRLFICTFIIIFLVLAGITVLTLWLVYRPHKPKFRVVSAAVYELNASSPPFISTTLQFTVVTRNPNKRVSIYYDQLSAFVSYKNQAITPPMILPPFFLGTKSTIALSPVLGGTTVAVAEEVVNGLVMDEAYGVAGLRLVLRGKLRYSYKAGAIIKSSAHYGIYVRCDVYVGLKKGFVGQLPLLGSNLACTVDVM